MLLVQREVLRHPVHRGGGAEHDPLDPVLGHHLEQVAGARDVVAVVPQRDREGLAHRLQRREVDDGLHGGNMIVMMTPCNIRY